MLRIFFGFLAVLASMAPSAQAELTKVRIGWQVPWAVQGQLVQILKHKPELLSAQGLEAEFVGRNFGPDLNGAAANGALDVILTADQPAAALFAMNLGWRGIGRMMYNRTLTYTYKDSPIQRLEDLRGKRIGVPMGAAAERITVEALARVGINARTETNLIDLGIREHANYILGNANKREFDAFSGFDPTPAIFQAADQIRVLDIGKVVSMIAMRDAFIQENPGVAEKLLKSFLSAYEFYRDNRAVANAWFREASGLANVSDAALDLSASLEPNLQPGASTPNLMFSEEDFVIMQRAAQFVSSRTGGPQMDMRRFVTNAYAESAFR